MRENNHKKIPPESWLNSYTPTTPEEIHEAIKSSNARREAERVTPYFYNNELATPEQIKKYFGRSDIRPAVQYKVPTDDPKWFCCHNIVNKTGSIDLPIWFPIELLS